MTHEIQHLMQQLRLPGMRAAYEGIVSTKNMQSIDYRQNGTKERI
jgi:hypothetical protein